MKKVNCILLVDDNEADNYYNQYIIQECGICNHIQVVINGVHALDYLRKAGEDSKSFPKPDLIILDINMPCMNGFEFLEQYKNLNENLKSNVLIVMLTTSFNPEDHERAMTFDEVKEYLNKPISGELLQEITEKYF